MEKQCSMFECTKPLGEDGMVIRHKGKEFAVCSDCIGNAARLKLIFARKEDGSFEVMEMVGI